MRFYIDGYNFIFRFLDKEPFSLEEKRTLLITLIKERLSGYPFPIIIVFDGSRDIDLIGQHDQKINISIVFTEKNQTADDYILNEIDMDKHPSQITVISSDKHLAFLCKQKRANTQSLSLFFKWLNQAKKQSHQSNEQKIFCDTKKNIQRLEKIFNKRLKELSEDD